MFPFPWRKPRQSKSRHPNKGGRSSRSGFRPTLEALEDRLVPSAPAAQGSAGQAILPPRVSGAFGVNEVAGTVAATAFLNSAPVWQDVDLPLSSSGQSGGQGQAANRNPLTAGLNGNAWSTSFASFAGVTEYSLRSSLLSSADARANPLVQVSHSGGSDDGSLALWNLGLALNDTGSSGTHVLPFGNLGWLSGAPTAPGWNGGAALCADSPLANVTVDQGTPVEQVADAKRASFGPETRGSAAVNGGTRWEVRLTSNHSSSTGADPGNLVGVASSSKALTGGESGSADWVEFPLAGFHTAPGAPEAPSDGAGSGAFPSAASLKVGSALDRLGVILAYSLGRDLDLAQLLGLTSPADAAPVGDRRLVPPSLADGQEGSTNFVPANFTSQRPTPSVQVTSAGGVCDGRPHTVSARVNGAPSLEGVGLSLRYQQLDPGGHVIGDLGNQAPVAPGIYRVTAVFPGSRNYAPASAQTTFAIVEAVLWGVGMSP